MSRFFSLRCLAKILSFLRPQTSILPLVQSGQVQHPFLLFWNPTVLKIKLRVHVIVSCDGSHVRSALAIITIVGSMSEETLVHKDGVELKSASGCKRRKRKKRKRVNLAEKLNFCAHMRAEATSKQVCEYVVSLAWRGLKSNSTNSQDLDRVILLLQRIISNRSNVESKHRRISASSTVSLAATNETDKALRRLAFEHLALLLLQEGQRDAAESILQSEGFRYTFADCVVQYVVPTRPSATTVGAKHVSTTTAEANKCVRVYSPALPRPILEKLQTVFAVTSPFWKEHRYLTTTRGGEKKCGYFSYAHARTSHPSNLIEQVANHVFKLYSKDFPSLSECKFVEWWAHCRPHSDGHQMHFDSADEGVPWSSCK